MKIVLAYDISSDRQRAKVAKILEGVMVRVQWSVFEGDVPAEVLDRTVRRILPHLDAQQDSVRVYRLCAACSPRVDVYGRGVDLGNSSVRIL